MRYTIEQLFRRDIRIRRSLKMKGLRKPSVKNPLGWRIVIIDHIDVPHENRTQKVVGMPDDLWFRTYEDAVTTLMKFFKNEIDTASQRRQLIT